MIVGISHIVAVAVAAASAAAPAAAAAAPAAAAAAAVVAVAVVVVGGICCRFLQFMSSPVLLLSVLLLS